MADKKATTPAAKASVKPAPKKRPAKPVAPKPTYEDLVAFKGTVDLADEQVKSLRRRLRSARTEDTILLKAQKVAEVEAALEAALTERNALVDDYLELKREVYSYD